MSDAELDSEDVYEVEKITNHVICDGETFYCVTWKGYEGPDSQTWEPKENLLSCEDLLNAYIENHKTKSVAKNPRKKILQIADSSEVSSSSEDSTTYKSYDKTKEVTQRKSGRGRGRGRGRRRGSGRGRVSGEKVSSAITNSSSEESGTSSEESPHVKDPFWENLQKGKIDVFSGDLYSKVKRRRGPQKEEHPLETTTITAVTIGKKRGPKKKEAEEKDVSNKEEQEHGTQEQQETKEDRQSPKTHDDVTSDKSGSDESSSGLSSPVLDYLDHELKRKHKPKSTNNKSKGKQKEATPVQGSETKSTPGPPPGVGEEKRDDDVKKSAVEAEKPKVNRKDSFKSKSAKPDKPSAKDPEVTAQMSEDSSPGSVSLSSDSAPATKEKIKKTKSDDSKEPEKQMTKADAFTDLLQELESSVPTIVPRKKDKKKSLKPSLDKLSINQGARSSEKSASTPKEKSDVKSGNDQSKPSQSPMQKQFKEKSKLLSTSFESSQSAKTSPRPVARQLSKEEKSSRPGEKSKLTHQEKFKDKTPASKSSHAHSSTRASSKPKDTSSAVSQRPSANQAADKATAERTDGFSVFEAMQQEFGDSSGSSSKPLTSVDSGTTHSDSVTKAQNVNEAGNDDLDMSEYLKVKVNFSLDEISLKEIEQHHEAGEPPCRLNREISNAEFRQFIRANNYEMVFEVLKSKGRMYNLEHQDSMWMTQLMIASAAGYTEIVKVLAHHGARVNARTKSGQTALMLAAEKGHTITVRVLLLYGAYVNLQTSSGETALMKAVKCGHLAIAHSLLQAGADPCLKSPHGVSALNMEGRLTIPVVALAKKHKQSVETAVHQCISSTVSQLGLSVLGSSLFGVKTYNVREHALVYFTYHCTQQDLPPNQGLMLFAVHGLIGTGLSLKCRMRGPCHVNAVTVNNAVMEPVMPTKESDKYTHFMTNIVWRTGQNSFRLFLAQDGLSREKIYLAAFVLGFS